jgi:putative ABC transport system permease protein
MANGFSEVLANKGRDDRVIVLGSGASAELVSGLTRADVGTILDSQGIRRGSDGKPLASPEMLMLVTLNKSVGGRATSAVLRGMEPRALAVRPEMRITSGRMFSPAVRELIVGKGAQRLYRGMELGSHVMLRGAEWIIVGVFSSAGDVHESELIADAETLMSAYRREVYQSVTAVLAPDTSVQHWSVPLKSHPGLRAEVQDERGFYLRQAKTVNDLLAFVIFVVGGFMAIGALFAALNTMYSAVSSRASEIATLRAMGFSPTAVVVSVFTEAILLALIGAVCGALLSWALFGGHTVSSTGSDFGGQVAFDIRISGDVLAAALQAALLTATVGALFPAIRAARMHVVDVLRSV